MTEKSYFDMAFTLKTRSLSDAQKRTFSSTTLPRIRDEHSLDELAPLASDRFTNLRGALSVPNYSKPRSKSIHYIPESTTDPLPWNNASRKNRSRSLESRRSFIFNYKKLRRLNSIQLENEQLLEKKNADTMSELSADETLDSNDDLLSADSSIRLEEHIKLHHLQKLLQIFKSHNPHEENKDGANIKSQGKTEDEDSLNKQGPGMMTLQEFKVTISRMLGTNRFKDQMEMLFHKVDTACDNFVDWNEFCTYMLLQMREIEHKQNAKLIPFTSAPVVKQIFHNKQETTTKSVVVENPSRILTVSKIGSIGVWDFQLRLFKTYSLSSDVAESQQQTTRRRFHTWVTDLVYMRNTQNLALTTSSREIYFYDISTSIYTIEFCLYALPNVPVCAHYWYNKQARNSHSMLFFGDDTGAIHVLHFHSPQSRLFQKPFNPKQGTQRVYFNDLRDHRKYVTYEHLGNVHNEVVRRIMYVRDSDIIISSSMSSSTSVVLMDFEQKKKPYIFKVNKGVECFDYSKSLNILVTGSLDHLVRIWNPYVVARPITVLQGHSTGICDVVINEGYSQIVTYSKDVVLKVWDVLEQNCLQTVSPKFQSLQPGRIPEHGEFPLSLYGSPHDIMIVTCNDSVAVLKMGKLAPKEKLPTTHDAPLCGVLYNSLFHQVVTASDASTVSVWDLETGSRSLTFSNAHAQEEITCLSFDHTNRRLFTGARDGSIKIWNFQNGNCLHELEAVEEAEVTGILSFQDRTILAVGWSRLIALYDDSDPDMMNISAKTNWKGGQLHEDDILAVAHGPPNLLATGSYDGCIIVWNEETQQVYLKIREGTKTGGRDPKQPVDALMFLPERPRNLKKDCATLISSEGGTLFWWCLFGRNTFLGSFHAAEATDDSILALCSSPCDSFLITGDTSGFVSVWNIEDYCMSDKIEQQADEKPPNTYHWKAHDRAIVSVVFIDHELQAMIVTASTDKTSRLWTLEGRLIGTFGQQKKWNIKQPTSYQYPLNPWGERVMMPEPGHANAKKISGLQTVHEEENDIEDNIKETHSIQGFEVIPKIPENKEEEKNGAAINKVGNPADDVTESQGTKSTQPADHISNESEHHKMSTNAETANQTQGISMEDQSKRKETVDCSGKNLLTTRQMSILGESTEKLFDRRSSTRQERRTRVGFIDGKRTSRFGNLCSPFQALAIRDTEAVKFESTMPMTERMRSKGMSCSNESDLHKMPLNSLFEISEAEQVKGHKKRPLQSQRRNTVLPPIVTPSTSSLFTVHSAK